jgi:pimeloyl-ACP methyl ester carboxylesterase
MKPFHFFLAGVVCLWTSITAARGADSARRPAIEAALAAAGTNRVELESALAGVPAPQRGSLEFLLEHMPARDLESLGASYLLEHVALAHEALAAAPWRDRITSELFLNDILPYASVTERREAWRQPLREECLPLVQECRTPGEAACRLNERLFPLVKVKYSTQRRRADQGALETMESGLASCTGLSILLIDACRSVGVPARLVGTPSWVDKRGNHTWVEVWDDGWHFLGAAEPDPAGLDRGWFTGDAARARRDSRESAIYASSFRRTGLTFPLVWAPRADYVPAVNVTERYTRQVVPPDPDRTRLLVTVRDAGTGQRVAAAVRLLDPDDSAFRAEGTTRDERFDTNDLLEFLVPRGRAYRVEAEFEGRSANTRFAGTDGATATVALELGVPRADANTGVTNAPALPDFGPPPPPASAGLLSASQARKLRAALAGYFTADPAQRATWKFATALDRLLLRDEAAVRGLAWEAFRTAPEHAALRTDFDARQVRFEQHLSPYTVKLVGRRPASGWPLFIAMHGGGNAPKRVNDQQWGVMQRYYRDQESVTGYCYVALRAPNDTWNGFYDTYVYPLVANLIRQFVLFAEVDPDKVFLMGYSHGGYGAFAIGPKLPDRFAAIHASAAAPTDGETSAKTLRNTVFTYMIGEKDLAYGRLTRCQAFDETVRKLRGDRTDIYPVTMEFIAGNGHTGLPDREKIRSMYPAVRQPVPRELTWEMTDGVVRDFFWLEVPAPGKQQEINATCRDNRVIVTTRGVSAASVLLDGRLVDLGRPVVVEVNGRSTNQRVRPALRVLCETMALRGDPALAFSVRVPLPLEAPRK